MTDDQRPAPDDVLRRFSPATQDWFHGAFEGPTAAQAGAWDAVSTGRHALVVAPTGSGKTLAAFLWALDGILSGRAAGRPEVADPATWPLGSADDATPPPGDDDPMQRCHVLYVSPLKALATDVERNLRSPLVGILQAATRRGLELPDVRVGVRTGDTPPAERRAFATKPPDILITTPESLFLVLTSAARSGLSGVRTVIIDEIHAVAGTKRGAHLAASLERLDAMLDRPGGPGPAQRVGLSATVTPVDRVAGFLSGARTPADGGREVVVVQPPSSKVIEVDVVVPVPDLADLASAPDLGSAGPGADRLEPLPDGERDLTGQAAGPGGAVSRPSIWPHVEERVVDLVAAHRSTLVFTNSRRGAERLTARMNEIWAARQGEDVPDHGGLQPAQAPGQSGTTAGIDTREAETILARAHHGSMSRAERTRTESELKAGRLPAVVATSSLELGIDMGAVDLVVQVGAPPSAASGLQRIGRAGHQVGAVSHGVVFPAFRGDLVPAAVTSERMRAGLIEPVSIPANPLDVLAQQIVAMVATEDWPVADLAVVLRRAAPFATLGEGTLRAVLDMLAGRYPSEEFAELRPRIVWDRAADLLTARPRALRLAVTSGGTIPDRGLYGVFLASGAQTADVPVDAERTGGQLRGGKRVGELDEEMVYESRVGDTFTLGSSTWRIEDITPDRVLVTPAPGLPGRLPFWKGDSQGRPATLGRAMGAWSREVAALPAEQARERVAAAGLDTWAGDNLLAYLREQQESTGALPSDATIVVERFRDELGDWRVVVHSPYGARVHAPWALVVGARLRERFGVDAAAMHADDGIVLRLPDMIASGDFLDDLLGTGPADPGADESPVTTEDLLIEPDEVATAVRTELGGSAMFGARFREAAARALLLPRRRPDRRQPLWQQRQRSAQLLAVASRYPDFPILLEAVRECLQDDFDVDALVEIMRDVQAGRIRVVEVTTSRPSPFAQSLLFGYTAQFLYDGDAPLAERRAAALTLDPALLEELLGGGGDAAIADLLDPEAVERTEAEVSGVHPDRQARDLEGLADVVRRHGPLPLSGVLARTREDVRDQVPDWLTELEHRRRLIRVRMSGVAEADQWAAIEDAGRLRDALGVALPVGVPEAFTEVLPDPLGDLLRRHARTHGPFTAAQAGARFGLGTAVVQAGLRGLERTGAVVQGRLRPDALGGTGDEYCDADVLRTLRRRSLAALRSEVEPVPQQALARFLPAWQHATGLAAGPAGAGLRGVDGVARAVEQLAGAVLPASALEQLVLPARVRDYRPAMLDELTASGEVLWAGHGTLPGKDGLVSLHLAATADLTLPLPPEELPGTVDTDLHRAVLAALSGGGAYFLGALADRVVDLLDDGAPPPSSSALTDAVWDLVWAGLATNDGLAPLRARLGAGRTAHRTPAAPPRARSMAGGRYGGALGLRGGMRPPRPAVTGPDAGGRWSLLPRPETDPTRRAHALAAQLLDRHGVLTRAVAPAEGVTRQFAGVYRVLSALEQSGQVRRGYFTEHLGGSQFALPGAVDELRGEARRIEQLAESGDPADADRSVVLLAATDPANPYGAALAWPPSPGWAQDATGHRPGRKSGAVVVLVDGALVLYLEKGGRTVLTFTDRPDDLRLATARLADAVREERLGRITLVRADGVDLLVAAGSEPTPLTRALADAGFVPTPRGLRLRGAR
ncbi:ATP-dependent helicase [Cellulomonas denverensis]|uniref:ATP-dependent helicase n=1 Tax=Cellulomonas denverensis TaxID=264297 RepID=A0A7X6KXJ7_9CELL|nr:ATP-dependent helicase [Cellulomonas denverensis]NKY23795.1 ATP-dependent helicase [Cellulomonas denverensis]GIG25197.1 DEAD/DEAH box helicase [Cellulomonas denverensis]